MSSEEVYKDIQLLSEGELLAELQRLNDLLQKEKLKDLNQVTRWLKHCLKHVGAGYNVLVVAKINYLLGVCSHRGNKEESALNYLLLAERLLKHSDQLNNIPYLYITLGSIYRAKGNFDKAVKSYLQVIEHGNDNTIASAYNNIAVVYKSRNNFNSALEYYLKALAIYELKKDYLSICGVKLNIGNIYYHKKNFDKSKEYWLNAAELAKQYQLSNLYSLIYYNLGEASLKNDLNECAHYIELGIHSAKESKVKTYLPLLYLLKGSLSERKRDIKTAIKYYKLAVEAADSNNVNYHIRALKKLSHAYTKSKNFKDAYSISETLLRVQAKISQAESKKMLKNLKLELEIKKKDSEINLLKKEKEFNDLLKQKNEEIEKQNETLNRINDDLRAFNYAVSHDLKEPIRTVASVSDLIAKKFTHQLTEELLEMQRLVVVNSKRSLNMLDDLLIYSMHGLKETALERVDLNETIQIVQHNLAQLIKDKNAVILFKSEKEYTLLWSKSIVVQLLQNILVNALKYSREEASPRVEIRARVASRKFAITIKDNGIGIGNIDPAALFKIFYRGNINKHTEEGTGIGLALCKKIVTSVSGNITLNKNDDHGVTISVFLPTGMLA